jgi:protein-tyrosine phosphatase
LLAVIDLHCHFLPGVDDGAQTLGEALELARAAVADGITTAVMTPHVHIGRYKNTRSSIAKEVIRFRRKLAAEKIPLRIVAGGEVHMSPEVMELEEAGELPCIGVVDGYRVVLVEFPHGHIPLGSDRLVQWMFGRNIRPMIAHPERNKAVMHDPEKIYPFVAMGCMLQLTAGAVVGQFGSLVQKCSLALLEREWVTVLATDAHNLNHRPPNMSLTKSFLEKWGGASIADNLTRVIPAAIAGLK